jgi:hypothetical protein
VTQEQLKGKPPITLEELEGLIEKKEPRLPKSIRIHIRNLKASGQWEQAMEIAERERGKKIEARRRNAELELYKSIRTILETDDPQIQGVQEIRTIWLLHASGVIDLDEKIEELTSILDSKSPDLNAYLEGRLLDIREELQPLLPTEKNLPVRRTHRS